MWAVTGSDISVSGNDMLVYACCCCPYFGCNRLTMINVLSYKIKNGLLMTILQYGVLTTYVTSTHSG